MKFDHKDFPHLSQAKLNEIGLPLPKKPVQVLIGNPNLSLQPSCHSGFGCPDCAQDRCLLQSKFGAGWVPLGNFGGEDTTSIGSIRHVCLQKVSPALKDMFFQGEALGVSPIERCTQCKLSVSKCHLCNGDSSNLTFQEEEEYNVMNDHVNFNDTTGRLEAKYPFSKDPSILVNNWKEAKACQVNQEKRQLREGTHGQYVEQFRDMLDRNVISLISDAELSSYTSPINYITHHAVHKPGSLSTPVRLVSNSSFRNGATNLNDLMVKGPNSLADLYSNLLKFRSYQVTLVFDITKAYNSIKTGLVERHVRRLWFRESPDEEWKQYAFDCVQFGN